jgi:lipopolysaccharide transport system permease protein
MSTHTAINSTQEPQWTEVIQPTNNLLDLKLGELWRYRDLVALFVRRDFVAQYKQTILGPAWHFIQPVLTTLMFTIVFGRIAGISTDGVPPMLFYITSITIWNYFSACLTKTSTTFTANANIFGKVYFPRLAVPVSVVISSLLQFAVQLLPLLVVLFYYILFQGYVPNITAWIITIPYLVILMAFLGLGLGIIISALTTKYRDLGVLVTFGVQLLMYASAVVFPLSSVSPETQKLLLLNPTVPVIEGFRYALLGCGSYNLAMLGYTTAFTLVVFFLGVVIFNKIEKSFMDTV